MTHFALFKYSTANLGDEIQSLAARQFLPRVDSFIDRDLVSRTSMSLDVKLIANGWYTHRPDAWPPDNPRVKPLLVSVHLSNEHGSDLARLTDEAALAFYRRHAPIGCRDRSTLELLRACSVEAYLSGCLTLTLRPRAAVPERNRKIYLVDVPREVAEQVPPSLRPQVCFVSHVAARNRRRRPFNNWRAWRFWRAQKLLDLYANAHLVITNKLHCALPCRAFDTPVIFAPERIDDPRFEGLLEYLNAYPLADLLAGNVPINWSAPASNPGDIRPMQDALRSCCERFVAEEN